MLAEKNQDLYGSLLLLSTPEIKYSILTCKISHRPVNGYYLPTSIFYNDSSPYNYHSEIESMHLNTETEEKPVFVFIYYSCMTIPM